MLYWLIFQITRSSNKSFGFRKKYFPTCCHHQQIFLLNGLHMFYTHLLQKWNAFLFSCLAIIHIIWQVGKLQERYIVVLTAQPRFHFFIEELFTTFCYKWLAEWNYDGKCVIASISFGVCFILYKSWV